LVNADFVSKTDREFIQIENKWNHYLFYQIGLRCIEWIADLGSITYDYDGRKLFTYAKTYLNLLPDSLLDEQNEELSSINKSFNSGFQEAIREIKFIIDIDGNLKKCNEIILDETYISTVLEKNFFRKITTSLKELPHKVLNQSFLKNAYLNIERYNAVNLYDHLKVEENKLLLSNTINKLIEKRYDDFLKWLNEFCQLNDIDDDWLLTLPIVRIKEGVFSFEEVIEKELVHIKTSKTKKIENILEKIGYELTEFYLDDFKDLDEYVRQIESYLNKDLKLYERIASNNDLSKLNAIEKNSILTFLESLEQVGKSKYAETLPLFKPKQKGGALKPLTKLISNKCDNIPEWLTGFVIEENEENELADNFKKHLIKQADLLESVFCNALQFEEIKVKITPDKVESFYAYILKLHAALPEDVKLDYTRIPWLYVPKTNLFQLAATVYCPDSLLKLSKDKFESVKIVLQTLTEEFLPHYSSISLIESFALGCKKIPLTKLITKTGTFELIASNDFLDWLKVNGETDFLKLFNNTKQEYLFNISASNGQLQYYSNEDALNAAIASHTIAGKLVLLPKEVFSENRKAIGLLEGNDLLKYLLENGMATMSFVKFVYTSKDEALKKLYIDRLMAIELSSSSTYNKDTNEHKIFEIILDLGKEDEEYYDGLSGKITIDNLALQKKNISDNVIFKFSAKENLPERKYQLKLSEILTSYKDETAALTTVAENFVDLKNKNDLRTKVLKATDKRKPDIFKEIHDLNEEYFTPQQMFFLLLYKQDHPEIDVKKDRLDFDEYWFDKDSNKHETFAVEMLNILFKQSYTSFLPNFNISGFNLPSIISEPDYALTSEQIPAWALAWINNEEKEKKQLFLKTAGLNCEDSFVVLLRKGFLEGKKELFDKGWANLDNIELLENTLEWLKQIQSENSLVLTRMFLQPLYEKLETMEAQIAELPIPVLKTYDLDSYELIGQSEDQEFHLINKGWGEWAEEIFYYLIISNKLIIDDILPLSYRDSLEPVVAECLIAPDDTLLINNSSAYNESYYVKWPLKSEYPIMIYKGSQLPYQIKYHTFYSESIFGGKTIQYSDTYYVTEGEKQDIPYSIKDLLPENIFRDLLGAKADYETKKRREEYEISYSDDENQALNRLFGDDIPKGFHKDLNLAALIKGLIYLQSKGYGVSDAEKNLKHSHKFSQLYPVYAPNAQKSELNAITVKCRSAKSGLLYMRASSWQELKNDRTYLYILTGKTNGECRFCKSRAEVIRDDKADFQVLRINATANPENIDAILSGEFDKQSMWLIIRVADKTEYRSIFEKIRGTELRDTIDNANVGDESND